ncbi:hypothetical protein [Rudaeicoccus suwonensis]|uniref:Uncharacterized protein n=1 Tax=Rudaeicoccus suwonensis TaxID=657409 RepID=A0A561E6R1_9MICO|nr:hypothetical protein [Rudaeicoccus suwonensis]TWE11303.1 hypothetical protein BKA23_0065 [Rudaeicoccus suwonensis]
MNASRATMDDLDWIVDLLADRRAPLVKYAPVFWHPAPDARSTHRSFIEYVITDGGARAYRTDHAVLIATRRAGGWLVDDAHVTDQQWCETSDAHQLWEAFTDDCEGSAVRFVCPVHERERAEFASTVGLSLQESWWLTELSNSGGQAGLQVDLPGAVAMTVGAPPVYAPPGPILFLPKPSDATTAVPAALAKSAELGCAVVVVNQRADEPQLGRDLESAGLRRHCDYFTGTV